MINSNGDTLFSSSRDQTIKIWQLQTEKWQCVQTLEGDSGSFHSLVINSTGNLLFGGSSDGTIRAWRKT